MSDDVTYGSDLANISNGNWAEGDDAPTIPDSADTLGGQDVGMAYVAGEKVTPATVVPTGYPSMPFPGPPWAPGWPIPVDGNDVCVVTVGDVLIGSTSDIVANFFDSALAVANHYDGEICQVSAKIGGVTVQIKKATADIFTDTIDYKISQHDGVNYGIDESPIFDLDSSNMGDTITVYCVCISSNPKITGSDEGTAVLPFYYYWTDGVNGIIYQSDTVGGAVTSVASGASLANSSHASEPTLRMVQLSANGSYWMASNKLVLKTTDLWSTVSSSQSIWGGETSVFYHDAVLGGNWFAGASFIPTDGINDSTDGITYADGVADADENVRCVIEYDGKLVAFYINWSGTNDLIGFRAADNSDQDWLPSTTIKDGLTINSSYRTIIAHSDGTTLYVINAENSGQYRLHTTTDLVTWTHHGLVSGVAALMQMSTKQALIKADDGSLCWLTALGSQIYRSTDDGLNWSLAGTIAGVKRGIYKDWNGDLYAGIGSTTWAKSEDDGESWSSIAMPLTGVNAFVARRV